MSQDKISVYNLADLKGTTDDALPNYLNSLGFKQSHTLVDTRLAIGYTAFALSAACFAWDYKLGFDNTKHYTTVAVVIYTLLNAILTAWIFFKEKGMVYVGTAPSGDTITVASSTTKNVPIYNLTINVKSPRREATDETIKVSRSFAEWFDVTGTFIALPFQTMIASSVPLVAKFDPKRVTSEPANTNDQSPEALETVSTATSVEAESVRGKKSGKRRKA